MVTVTATIVLERSLWVGVFERTDREGYAVARRVFGGEPSDAEIYDFVLQNYSELKFGSPQELKVVIKRMNPKRQQREVRREMARAKQTMMPSTFAQDYMREELEKNKKEKKALSSQEKQARKDRRFSLSQAKRKAKHRGH